MSYSSKKAGTPASVAPRANYTGRQSVAKSFGDGRTKQSFKKECDINNIVARIRKGDAELPAQAKQVFADVSGVPDYLEMRNRIAAADELFAALPSRVRRALNNDPARLVELSSTAEGVEQLAAMGLKRPQEAAPPKAEPPAAPTPPSSSSKPSASQPDSE